MPQNPKDMAAWLLEGTTERTSYADAVLECTQEVVGDWRHDNPDTKIPTPRRAERLSYWIKTLWHCRRMTDDGNPGG